MNTLTLTNCDLCPTCKDCKYYEDCASPAVGEPQKYHPAHYYVNYDVIDNLKKKVKKWDEMPLEKLILERNHIDRVLGFLLQDIEESRGTLDGLDLIASHLQSLLDKCPMPTEYCDYPSKIKYWLDPWEEYADFYNAPECRQYEHLYAYDWGEGHCSYWNGSLEEAWVEPVIPIEVQGWIFKDLAEHAPSDELRAEWFIEDDLAEYYTHCEAWENYYAGL